MSIETSLKALFSLQDKVIVLTGAVGGIGSVLAKELSDCGAKMILCDIAKQPLGELCAEINEKGGSAEAYELNMSHFHLFEPCVSEMIERNKKIDVLINCAGINKREGFLDVTVETYDRIMDVNLKGLYFFTQEVVKHMITQKKGNIINMASHNSVGMLGGCSVYGASKSAVTALTRSMAIEWAKHGIRANAVAPGHILTNLTTVTWEHPERSKYLKERIAMERPGTPEELVGITVMLASDSSSYMSGMMIHVDGGSLAGGAPWDYDTRY